jgi:hypothetical protein
MSLTVYIGIDPGASGAAVAIDGGGRIVGAPLRFSAHKAPGEVGAALTEWLPSLIIAGARVALEGVSSSPQMGVTSAFAFGRAYGEVLGAVAASARTGACTWEIVTPSVWQRDLHCPKRDKAAPQSAHKKALRAVAERMAGGALHADVADAYLLAEWARSTGRWAVTHTEVLR